MRFCPFLVPPESLENFCKSQTAPMFLFRRTGVRFDRGRRANRSGADSGPLCKSPPREQKCAPLRIRTKIPLQEHLYCGVFRTDPSANRNACRQFRPFAGGRCELQSIRSFLERRSIAPNCVKKTPEFGDVTPSQ